MVHQKISNDMKERALYLLLEADRKDCRSLGRAGEKYRAMGRKLCCVKPFKSIKGCHRLLTGDMIDDIQLLLRKDPTLLDEIRE